MRLRASNKCLVTGLDMATAPGNIATVAVCGVQPGHCACMSYLLSASTLSTTHMPLTLTSLKGLFAWLVAS